MKMIENSLRILVLEFANDVMCSIASEYDSVEDYLINLYWLADEIMDWFED
jgi:hypothetical protein